MEAITSQLAMCAGKEAFHCPELAWKAARRRVGRRAYRCACCGLWYVGTETKRLKKHDQQS